MTFPFPVADNLQNGLIKKLMKLVAQQKEQIFLQHDQIIQLQEQAVQQQECIEALAVEFIRVKKYNPELNIKPNKNTRHKRTSLCYSELFLSIYKSQYAVYGFFKNDR